MRPFDAAGEERMGVFREQIEELEDSPIVEVFRSGWRLPGLIAMWAGEADVPTPEFICAAASRALHEGRTFYSYDRGLPALREALIAYHRRLWGVEIPDARISLTLSGMNAVMLVAQATVQPGDNVVAITPSWPNIMRAMQINGAAVRQVMLGRGNAGWRLDLEALFEACDARTRVIYLASPGNPTGWQIERPEAERILSFARERGIAILADEVYHRIVYDRPVGFSFLEIARPDDPVFVVNSFSKAWAMTGWRLGWVVFPEGGLNIFEKLIQFNTSGGLEFLQAGCIAALEQGEDFVRSFVERCRAGRDVVNTRLGAMPRVTNIPGSGAFYAMFAVEGVTDTLTFCKRAVQEARIGMAPGTAFGRGAEHLVRLCYAKSPENLHEAMDRFAADYVE
jgi:aspartate/methionine/tyrosine aminotransferase